MNSYDKLIDDIIEWASKKDPKDIKRWEYFMNQYLIHWKWDKEARKQFIKMGDGGFNYNLLHIETSIKDFYGDVYYCSDRMSHDRLLRCHIQYRTLSL